MTVLHHTCVKLTRCCEVSGPEKVPGALTSWKRTKEDLEMSDEDKVWPTGLTLKEAEEVHSYLIDGTRVFGAIALIAHMLVAISTPWLG